MNTNLTPRVTPMRKARRKGQRTIAEMAREIGVSLETYRRWEQGTQRCPCPQKVADALGIAREEVPHG